MKPVEAHLSSGWQAELHLGFTRRGEATLLSDCRHRGPLRVQKALYPEGEAVCQAIVLHPPSGIAGGDQLAIEVTVDRHRPPPPRNSRAPYLVYASDDTGDVVLTFFRAKPGYVEKLLPVGAKRYVSGTLQFYDGMPQMVHPDRVVDEQGFATLPLMDGDGRVSSSEA